MNAIEARGLAKTYATNERRIEALKPLTMSVAQGEIFGLLGPNGAGKTTMLKLFLGIAAPSAGDCLLLGQPLGSLAAKRSIGYLPENHRFPLHLTGQQLLEIFGALADIDRKTLKRRIDEVLELVRMTEWRTMKIRQYSKGMMQRIGLAQALLNAPKLLFLDEPTDGIDPVGRKEVRDILATVKQQGTTIFLNSHLLSEVERISDRVAILHQGTIVRMGTTTELTQSSDTYRITLEPTAKTINFSENEILRCVPGARSYQNNELEIKAATPESLNAAIDALRSRSFLIRSITPHKNSLEELFFSLVGAEDETVQP